MVGSLATAFVLLCAAAMVAMLVSVHFVSYVGDSSSGGFISVDPDYRLLLAFVIPPLALLAAPFAFIAGDHQLRRAALAVGGWLVTVICLLGFINLDQGAAYPGLSVPKPPTVHVGTLSTTRLSRAQVLGRAEGAGLRIELHTDQWPSPSLRAWARMPHVGWGSLWGTTGAPFVALTEGSANAPQVLRGLLVKDGFTIRDVGFSDGLTFVIADAPGAAPAGLGRVRTIGNALRGTA